MTTHVFVVNSTTFKLHLEYLFAGTGAKEYKVDFNNSPDTNLHHSRESLLVDMMADAGRIRKGDKIIFYLQQSKEENIYEGKFYGVFTAKSNWSFLDNYDDEQYLKDELGKPLSFRTLIEPQKVYPKGVTEWEALDEIKNIQSPNQMLWSLIYRKLKGNRGNTMITMYESERLCQLIRNKNSRQVINVNDKKISFNKESQEIILTDDNPNSYTGRKENINILPRLISKYKDNKAFESHLQAYIIKNICEGSNESLDSSVLSNTSNLEWLGNEVSCGVGMQRIDIMISTNLNDQRTLVPIELKAVEASAKNIIQIQRYIDWIEQYYIPNQHSDIQPVLICKETEEKDKNEYREVIKSFKKFNDENSVKPIKYVEYSLIENDLIFNDVSY